MIERDEDTFAASGKTVYRDCINWSNNDHCAKTKANYCHPDCGYYRQLVKLVKRPETLEDIEADLRSDNRRFSNSTGAVIAQRIEAARKRMEWTYKKELETRDAVIQTEVAAREADREAHKGEKDALQAQIDELRLGIEQYRQYNARCVKEFNSKLGNTAKLREALKLYDRIFQDRTLVCDCDIVNGARALARAALAAPARNCDVGTAEEQGKRFTEFCYKNRNAESCCGDCPAFNKGGFAGCELEWAQMPYEESEAAK